ncbi:MAG: MBL fold metallo-hydrolase [Gemmatimonadetes bacterium]|nr:MBL fold metallo-hydrolase [Gemmatimonadota bacterium]
MNTQHDYTELLGVTVGPFQENTFFLKATDSPETIVIDPGDEAERLIGELDRRGWSPIAIVNTHAHLDHIGAVQALKDHYSIPFFLHSHEIPILEAAPEHARMFGIAPPVVPAVDHLLDGLERLELAGLTLSLVLTPGHSTGSVSFFLDNRMIGGDVLFQGSIGRTDLPGGDYATLMGTLRDLMRTLPDETAIHPGHGPDTTMGEERRTNPFLLQLDPTGESA